MNVEQIDNKLLNLLQSEFPLSNSPFKDLGDLLSISESEVIQRIVKLNILSEKKKQKICHNPACWVLKIALLRIF